MTDSASSSASKAAATPGPTSGPTVDGPGPRFEATALSASLTVKDLPTSVAWYRDTVGFAVEREMVRGGEVRAVAFRAGAVRLLLNQDDGAKGWDRVKGVGLTLMITVAGDIDAIASGITSRGGSLESEPADMPWGARVFRVRDPDGFPLVFSRDA